MTYPTVCCVCGNPVRKIRGRIPAVCGQCRGFGMRVKRRRRARRGLAKRAA